MEGKRVKNTEGVTLDLLTAVAAAIGESLAMHMTKRERRGRTLTKYKFRRRKGTE